MTATTPERDEAAPNTPLQRFLQEVETSRPGEMLVLGVWVPVCDRAVDGAAW